MTQYIGFKNYGDEYKVMGLSAYGDNSLAKKLNNLVRFEDNGNFSLKLDYFNHHHSIDYNWLNGTPKFENLYNKHQLSKLLGFNPKINDEELNENHINLAFQLKKHTRKFFFI